MEINEGELVGLIGINGIGKSTLLRTLGRMQPSLRGEIFVKSENLDLLSPHKLSRLISVVLTRQPIAKNLSVAELVALGRQPFTNWLGNLSFEDRQQTKNALELVDLEKLREKKCYELSDGQFQKVLIARALAQETPLIILDEPTSHLDMYHKAQVFQLLKKLSAETKKGILFATHEINLAIQLCDKIILMNNKEIIQGSPKELIEKEVFTNIFPSDLIVFDPRSQSFKVK